MRFRLLVPLVVAAATAAACRGEPTPVSDRVLTVTRNPPAFRFDNASAAPVYYFAAERNTLALIDWVPRVDSGVPTVPARGSRTVPYAEVTGYAPGADEAVVYWWQAVPDGAGGIEAGPFRTLVVRF
jgi:hypothetical protein